MARYAFAALVLVIFISPAAAIDFQVDIAGEAEASVYNVQNTTQGDLHEFNLTMENPSSVGCEYFLRGEFERGNATERRYSNGYSVWPGSSTDMELKYVPVNYTGQVNADIDLIYCDTVRNVTDYSFNVSTSTFESTFETETLEVDEESARARFSIENATAVPVRAPPFWRVGSSEIVNRKARLDYRPSLFQHEESITYALMENGTIQGRAEVSLEAPEPTLKEKIMEKRFEIASALAFILLLGNLYLLRSRILPEKVLESIREMETDRSIKR